MIFGVFFCGWGGGEERLGEVSEGNDGEGGFEWVREGFCWDILLLRVGKLEVDLRESY